MIELWLQSVSADSRRPVRFAAGVYIWAEYASSLGSADCGAEPSRKCYQADPFKDSEFAPTICLPNDKADTLDRLHLNLWTARA